MTNTTTRSSNKFFVLFASCIPVKGAKRSIICDIDRHTYIFIPNSMYDFLLKYEKSYQLKKLYSLFSSEEKEILDSYFDFLETNELIFLYQYPSFIS